MDVHNFFLILFLILITARILGEIFARMQMPSVLGELSAGILLGVSGLGLIEVNDVLKVLAEIGILLLLFEIGLDTDIKRLKDAGSKSVIVAIVGAVFPFTLSTLVAYYLFDLTLVVSFFIGGTLTATSIGITMRVLRDLKKEQTDIAQIVIGAAVIDDILGVIILVFIYDFATSQELSMTNTLNTAVFIILFLILAPIFAHLLSHMMKKFDKHKKVPGLIPTVIISLIALFAYLSHLLGAPEILGAFAAGIALSRRFILPFGMGLRNDKIFLQKVKNAIEPIAQMFTPIFFVMVGLSMNLRVIDFSSPKFWLLAVVFLLIAIIGKYIGVFLLKNTSTIKKALIGISMVPRGEVGLIFAEVGRVNGILDNQIYAVLIFVIIVTTVVPPFLLKWLFKYEKSL
ncbi:MAG: GerN [uncultured Sulfurovum sp.]|uniref:GerN n=1 Tax=uncultured Sulfurovum sp. TaxID=269237 RepID=A0A6S6U1G4_9BACT|nr:MAG: GerN [uncultured Sulfurovum sp.]